jgi:uncharacterized protein YPO0396
VEDLRKRIDDAVAEARREADELRVRVHLAKLEADDEWRELEAKLRELEDKAKELTGVSAEAAGDIGAAAKLLGEELRNGLKKFARHL